MPPWSTLNWLTMSKNQTGNENSGGRLAYRAHVAMSPNFNSIFSLRDHHAHNNSDWD